VTLSNTGNNNVQLSDANDVALAASTIGNNLSVSAGGNITQTGALVVSGGLATFTIDAGINKDILLAGFNNNFQTTAIGTANGGSVRDLGLRNVNNSATLPASLPSGMRNLDVQFTANPVVLPAITLSGTLNVVAAGSITQSGAVVVGSATTLDAGGNAITLTNASNNFSSIGATGGVVQITDINALALNAISATSLTVNTSAGNGAITQTAPAVVSGVTVIDAGSGNVTLTQAGNDFNSITVSGGAVSLVDTNALTVTAFTSGANQAVSLVAGGALTIPAGGIDTGSADLTLGSGGVLTMPGTLSGANISLSGAGGLVLANNITASGTLSLSSTNTAIN